jgi:hypothetical protein
MAESGMLPLYLQAVEGRREARIDMAYLHGAYRVEPWYKYMVFIDEAKHCSLSPICRAARGRGVEALRRWDRPKRPPRLEKIYRRLRRAGEEALRRMITELLEGLQGGFSLVECLE